MGRTIAPHFPQVRQREQMLLDQLPLPLDSDGSQDRVLPFRSMSFWSPFSARTATPPRVGRPLGPEDLQFLRAGVEGSLIERHLLRGFQQVTST